MSPVPKMARSLRGSLVGFLADCFWGVRLRRVPITTDPLPSMLNRARFILSLAVIGLLVVRIGMINEACGGGRVFGFVSEFGRIAYAAASARPFSRTFSLRISAALRQEPPSAPRCLNCIRSHAFSR